MDHVPASFSTPVWSSETKTTEPILKVEGQTDAVAPNCPPRTCRPSRSEDREPPSGQKSQELTRTLAQGD